MTSRASMRQWWTVPGDNGGVLELRQVPIPRPGPGEVLVRIMGTGINRGELISKPAMRRDNPSVRPRPSGIECAGAIATLGDGVEGFAIDDKVMARGSACHAEYALLAAPALMAVPEHLSFAEAAAIPNVFVTAHDAIVSNSRLKSGEKILITAGSSGVGSAAIQIAAYLGASEIIATSRAAAKGDRLREIGATVVVDTSKDDWTARIIDLTDGGVDVVIDQVGGEMFPSLLNIMAVAGRYISVGRNAGARATIDLDQLARDRLQLIGVTFRTRSSAEALACSASFARDLLPAFSQRRLRPVLDRAFALDQLAAAHEYMLSDQQFGKVVLAE